MDSGTLNDPRGRRMVLVHAHPDDESIGTGATMAMYAARGVQVTLVTCTLGELGEVIPPDLAHLAADRDGGLGTYRIGELDAACAALGVTDHRFLGGPGRWHDSGMMGLPANDAPGCFWQADVGEAAAGLLAVLREVQPQVLISYDANGFYGHPDHIQAHRVAARAFALAAGAVDRFYATAVPRSCALKDLPCVPDEQVSAEVDASAYTGAKLAAMAAHATQITVDPPFYALSNGIAQLASGREHYTLLAGRPLPAPAPGRPWAADLFS